MQIARGMLVLVMDGRKMLLMRNEGDVRQPELKVLKIDEAENPKSSLQGKDKPGRSFSSATDRRSSLENTDLHEETEARFTLNALTTLGEAVEEHEGKVIVLASPSALGRFRKHHSDGLKDHIVAEIDKDVVNHTPDDILKIIAAYEP